MAGFVRKGKKTAMRFEQVQRFILAKKIFWGYGHFKAMADFVKVLWLDVRERNSMAFTLDIRTKSHTVCGRPTRKLVERFRNGSVRELYERSIYERSFTSEPSIEIYQAKYAISNELSHIMFTCKRNRVFRRDREPSRIPEPTLR